MPRNPRIPPAWFDTEQGTLLVGSQQELGPLVDNPNVRRLGALLCAEEFPYKSGDFEQIIPTEDWGQEECKVFGQWMLRVLHPYTSELKADKQFTQEHIKRARILGVGPTAHCVKRAFDTMANFRDALGIHSGRARGKYDHWSSQDFVSYAAKLASSIGRRPTRDDYHDAHQNGGPGVWILYERFGGSIRRLNEHIGFPIVSEWDDDDFIQWGTDVMRANGEAHLSISLIETLSKRQAGPSTFGIRQHFDRISSFQSIIEQNRQEQLEEYAEHRDTQLRWAKENLDNESLALVEDLPEAEQLAFIGRYQTAQECLSEFGPATFRRLASEPGSFISQIVRLNKRAGFTAGNIEETAEVLGVFNDIWPPDEYLERLRVLPYGNGNQQQDNKEPVLKAA